MDPESIAESWRAGTRLEPGVACLERPLVLRAAQGTASRSERERVADHLGTCADCADLWKVTVTLATALGEPSSRRARPTQRWWWASIAASLAIALGAGLLLRPSAPELTPSIREPTARMAAELTFVPADQAVLTRPPAELAVTGGSWPELAQFEIVVLDAEATPIWTSPPLDRPRVAVPPELQLDPGIYYWRVRSLGARTPWSSPLVRFELR